MPSDVVFLVGTLSERALELSRSLAAHGFTIECLSLAEAKGAVAAKPAAVRAVLLSLIGDPDAAELGELDRAARLSHICVISLAEAPATLPGFGYIVDLASTNALGAIEAILAESQLARERVRELVEEVERRSSAIGLIMSGEFNFQTIDQAFSLATMLASACSDPQRVSIGLLELLINAVEHGNLEIDGALKEQLVRTGQLSAEIERRLALFPKRYATVRFEKAPAFTVFHILDHGKGFDPAPYLTRDPAAKHTASGRGILAAKELSFDELEYHGRGNEVTALILASD